MGSARPAPETMIPPLQRLLRPLVRLMLRSGVTFPDAADVLRQLFVSMAAEELPPAERTDSRMSLLTGIHRKEIRRQRTLAQQNAPPPPPPLLARNSQLIAAWLGAPGYTDADGAPIALPRSATTGPSFEALVTSYTRDVRPRAVLDDWLSQGIVTRGADQLIRLEAAAFLPRPGRDEQLFYFSRNLADHIAAAGANVLAPETAPFVDRSVHYDRLSPAAAAALEHAARQIAQRALLAVNRDALALSTEVVAAGQPTRRVNFGVYLYVEDEPPA